MRKERTENETSKFGEALNTKTAEGAGVSYLLGLVSYIYAQTIFIFYVFFSTIQ